MAITPPPAPKNNVVPMQGGTQQAHAKKAPHKKHSAPEEHEAESAHDDSNWIVSYADMMTLLCVFFVLMYSLSKPDQKKIEELKKETTQYFGGHYKMPYENLVDKLKQMAKDKGLEQIISIESDETGVTTTFRGTLFFESGKTELLPDGVEILKTVGGILQKEAPGFQIVVEGHTDDNPIVSPIFPSNWELSGARASRVIRMFESQGFNRKLLTGIGYADTRPIIANRDEQGTPIPLQQAQNRRVVLRVLKQ